MLTLKRMPEATTSEQYEVVFEGRHVGSIYLANPHDKHGVSWYWGVAFFERPKDTAHHANTLDGFAHSRDAAMAAFRAAWDWIAR